MAWILFTMAGDNEDGGPAKPNQANAPNQPNVAGEAGAVGGINPTPSVINMPVPDKMDMKGDLATNWQFFLESFQNYEVATELDKKAMTIRVATLKAVMGKDCLQVLKNLPLTDDDRKSSATILTKLGEHFEPS